MVICVERDAHLHMAQLMPLSLASVKSRLFSPFWYRLTRVVLEKGPLNGCVCVCAGHNYVMVTCFRLYSEIGVYHDLAGHLAWSDGWRAHGSGIAIEVACGAYAPRQENT